MSGRLRNGEARTVVVFGDIVPAGIGTLTCTPERQYSRQIHNVGEESPARPDGEDSGYAVNRRFLARGMA